MNDKQRSVVEFIIKGRPDVEFAIGEKGNRVTLNGKDKLLGLRSRLEHREVSRSYRRWEQEVPRNFACFPRSTLNISSGTDGLRQNRLPRISALKLRAAFKEAKGKMTAHGFRHFFITQTLATGVSVEDVSHMVGTSPNEIRKTYRHFVKEATDRLDDVQVQSWIKQGLDADGNPQSNQKKVAVQ
jgi:integrase